MHETRATIPDKNGNGAAFTVNEFWEHIGKDKISLGTLYEAISRGEVPSVRLGKRILIPRSAVNTMFGAAA